MCPDTHHSPRAGAARARHYATALLLLAALLCCRQAASASESDLRIDADTCAVMTIGGEGSILWVGTSKGLFRWDDVPNGLPQHVGADTGTVFVLLRDGDTLWVGAERGLFRWDNPAKGGVPRHIQGSPVSVTKLQRFGARLLIGATKGLHVWRDAAPAEVEHVEEAGQFVNAFLVDGGRAWVGTDRGLFGWDGKEEAPAPAPLERGAEVTCLYKDGAWLLAGTTAGLLRWADPPAGVQRWLLPDVQIHSLHKDGPSLLVSTAGVGLPRLLVFDDLRDERWRVVDDGIGASSKYYRNGRTLWMGAGYVAAAGLYRWETGTEEKPSRLEKINTGFVHNFYRAGDTLWIGAQNGLFRLEGLETDWDAKLEITGKPPKDQNTDSTPTIAWQLSGFGWRTTPQQVQYRVVVMDEGGGEVKLNNSKVMGLQTLELPPLPKGLYRLYVQATDLNGKTVRSQTISFNVAATWKAFLIKWGPWAVGVYLLLIGLAIGLAPYSDFSHNFLMNPWLRKYGSFGLIPLVLSMVRPARRHVLKRYLRCVRGQREFSKWGDRFVMPTDDFLPDCFGAELEREKRLMLQGQSGVGKTSYLRYLTWHYAGGAATPPAGAVPVFVPLGLYRSVSPEEMFSEQLSIYGELTDQELNLWFLEQGKFVIFLDGLNEVDEETRNHVYAFVERHRKANYFCISSQLRPDDVWGPKYVALAPLTEEKINDLLRKRLGPVQAEEIIRQFGGSLSRIYEVPQDVELAVAFKKNHPDSPLPGTKMELYEAAFDSILAEWDGADRTDYPGLLYQRAYEMLRARDQFFDEPDEPLPDDLTEPLVRNKYLVRRGTTRYMFRHDHVRSYLASKHFRLRWRELISSEVVEVDNNWRRMLEFSLLSIDRPDEARRVLEWVLLKRRDLAGELFSWMERTTPRLIDGWAPDFKLKYAEAMLSGATA